MTAANSQIDCALKARNDLTPDETDILNKYQANQIFMLQKNIEFLKKNHQEMLMTLHKEIEKLKRSNTELQQLLILERKAGTTSDEGVEIASMQSKIKDLESQLQSALQKSDALKRALESKKRFKLINGGPAAADSHSSIIQIAEKPRIICVGMSDSRFSTNDDTMGDSTRKWAGGSSFHNQNHTESDSPLVSCPIRELGPVSAPLPPILPPEPFISPNHKAPVSPRHQTTPNLNSSNPVNLISTYPRVNSNCRHLNDLKPCLMPIKLVPSMTPIDAPQSVMTIGRPKMLDAKPGARLVMKKAASSLSVDHITGPILSGITAKKPQQVQVQLKGGKQLLTSSRSGLFGFPENDEPMLYSHEAPQPPPGLTSLRHNLNASLRPFARRRLNPKDSKKQLF